MGYPSLLPRLQGTVAIIFGVAIAKSALLSRWIGAVEIFAGAATIAAAGVVVAYVGFSWRVEIHGEADTVVVSWWETNQTSDTRWLE